MLFEVMLPGAYASHILLLYLASFLTVNAHNLIVRRRLRGDRPVTAEVERPAGTPITLASLGTLIFFAEALLMVYWGYKGTIYDILPSLQVRFLGATSVQLLGLSVMGVGFILFEWSVLARGRHSVSWGMPENHELITTGPYRYIRHPSYMGYFLMFTGLLLAWLNVAAAIPLIAIPGYLEVAGVEEELLVARFGEKYMKYMETTGRFIPKLQLTDQSL